MTTYKILCKINNLIYIRIYDEINNSLNDYQYERFSPIEYECWKAQEDRKEVKNKKYKGRK